MSFNVVSLMCLSPFHAAACSLLCEWAKMLAHEAPLTLLQAAPMVTPIAALQFQIARPSVNARLLCELICLPPPLQGFLAGPVLKLKMKSTQAFSLIDWLSRLGQYR